MTDGTNRHLTIASASMNEVRQDSGDWVFVDMGFAQRGKKSCGVAIGDSRPDEVEFASLAPRIIEAMCGGFGPMNLLIEAPLSVAFDAKGNPTGRRIEKRRSDEKQRSDTRYWYCGLGCSVLTATTYLLRRLNESVSTRQVRLVEGFASFKSETNGNPSHADDVCKLRDLAWSRGGTRGCVVAPEDLKAKPDHALVSAFNVSGMDFGVPPVVVVL